ncbi:hypothetical protein EG835_08770, partial [bacterium]|nr:hypothetical protein [bacterium]
MDLSSLGESLSRGLTRVPAIVEGVLRYPSADPKMTLLVLAIALLLLASVVVLVLMALPRKKKRVRKIVRRWVSDATSPLEAQELASSESGDALSREIEEGWEESEVPAEAPPAPTRRGVWIRRALGFASAAGIPLLIAAALASAYALTGTDTACITCHGDTPAVLTVHENDHADAASCTSCHEQGTGADLVSAVTGRATMVTAQVGLVTTGTVDVSPVSNAACLRCHDLVLTGTMESSR